MLHKVKKPVYFFRLFFFFSIFFILKTECYTYSLDDLELNKNNFFIKNYLQKSEKKDPKELYLNKDFHKFIHKNLLRISFFSSSDMQISTELSKNMASFFYFYLSYEGQIEGFHHPEIHQEIIKQVNKLCDLLEIIRPGQKVMEDHPKLEGLMDRCHDFLIGLSEFSAKFTKIRNEEKEIFKKQIWREYLLLDSSYENIFRKEKKFYLADHEIYHERLSLIEDSLFKSGFANRYENANFTLKRLRRILHKGQELGTIQDKVRSKIISSKEPPQYFLNEEDQIVVQESAKLIVSSLKESPEIFVAFLKMIRQELLSLPIKESLRDHISNLFSAANLERVLAEKDESLVLQMFSFIAEKFSVWGYQASLTYLKSQQEEDRDNFLINFIPIFILDLHSVLQRFFLSLYLGLDKSSLLHLERESLQEDLAQFAVLSNSLDDYISSFIKEKRSLGYPYGNLLSSSIVDHFLIELVAKIFTDKISLDDDNIIFSVMNKDHILSLRNELLEHMCRIQQIFFCKNFLLQEGIELPEEEYNELLDKRSYYSYEDKSQEIISLKVSQFILKKTKKIEMQPMSSFHFNSRLMKQLNSFFNLKEPFYKKNKTRLELLLVKYLSVGLFDKKYLSTEQKKFIPELETILRNIYRVTVYLKSVLNRHLHAIIMNKTYQIAFDEIFLNYYKGSEEDQDQDDPFNKSIEKLQNRMNFVAMAAQGLTVIERSFSYQDLFLGKSFISPKEIEKFVSKSQVKTLFLKPGGSEHELIDQLIEIYSQIQKEKGVVLDSSSEHGYDDRSIRKLIRKSTRNSPGTKYFLRNLVSMAKKFWFKGDLPRTDDPYLQIFDKEISKILKSFHQEMYFWLKKRQVEYDMILSPPFLDLKTGLRLQ